MIIIDRFEGDKAILETDDGTTVLDRALIPQSAEEGDVLCFAEGVYAVDSEATEARRAEIREKLCRLIRRRND